VAGGPRAGAVPVRQEEGGRRRGAGAPTCGPRAWGLACSHGRCLVAVPLSDNRSGGTTVCQRLGGHLVHWASGGARTRCGPVECPAARARYNTRANAAGPAVPHGAEARAELGAEFAARRTAGNLRVWCLRGPPAPHAGWDADDMLPNTSSRPGGAHTPPIWRRRPSSRAASKFSVSRGRRKGRPPILNKPAPPCVQFTSLAVQPCSSISLASHLEA
jgi:hypothetical protein